MKNFLNQFADVLLMEALSSKQTQLLYAFTTISVSTAFVFLAGKSLGKFLYYVLYS
ncbi:hypothetical protein VUJ46_01940 [Chryseobacterium sp. MYb264]|uniref:hypothetical protein n=1 Tax=Chryseobacterium sp. MYb264 TaxID=2745153 RepID=UPI002E0DB847|nr:hypothetical protein VUJ46_01940 [Chryseobacterium sp. MYb264]